MIEGKTPEEIREIFHLRDDLTEEEKLEPLKNTTDDPRIRLLNRLYAKKRKELKGKDKLKNVEVEEERVDERSIDDLLSFINGEDGGSKAARTSKHKKKSQRRKDQMKNSLSNNTNNNSNKETGSTKNGTPCINNNAKLQECPGDPFLGKIDFDDVDVDDGLDPAMKEQLDREVEDFAKRLNSAWPERMQQMFSGLNANGSSHRYSGLDER